MTLRSFCCTAVIFLAGAASAGFPLFSGSKGEPLRLPDGEAQQLFYDKLAAAHGDVTVLEKILDADILAFQSLIEEGFVFRQKIAASAVELKAKSDAGVPLTGADLDQFNNGIGCGVDIARRVFAVVDTHANWRTVSAAELKKAGFTTPLPEPLRTKGTMLSLAGSLALYDTYRLEITALAENDKLRRILNGGDKGYQNKKNLLDDMTVEFLSISKRERASAELRYCEENQFATSACYGGQNTLRWLQQLIAQSSSREMLHMAILPAPKVMAEHAATRIGMIFGDIQGFGDDSMNTVSLCFGNTVGLVEVRKGKLWQDAAVAARIKNTLRPGDILLEKTPFRLTDTFIPGHWGHVAIWVGTEADLKDLDLWNDPAVKPYQAEICAGKCIVEALRPGVTMNTVEHFLNIDDLGILRRNPALDRDTLRHHILLAFRQVGKAYDFNFDVETTDKIVCSELAYVVYTDMNWPIDKALGRYTISPDNVALKALYGGPLELVLFYHDGRPVNEKPLERMAELMNKTTPSEQ
jgi:uncharacterized protein YycO